MILFLRNLVPFSAVFYFLQHVCFKICGHSAISTAFFFVIFNHFLFISEGFCSGPAFHKYQKGKLQL